MRNDVLWKIGWSDLITGIFPRKIKVIWIMFVDVHCERDRRLGRFGLRLRRVGIRKIRRVQHDKRRKKSGCAASQKLVLGQKTRFLKKFWFRNDEMGFLLFGNYFISRKSSPEFFGWLKSDMTQKRVCRSDKIFWLWGRRGWVPSKSGSVRFLCILL